METDVIIGISDEKLKGKKVIGGIDKFNKKNVLLYKGGLRCDAEIEGKSPVYYDVYPQVFDLDNHMNLYITHDINNFNNNLLLMVKVKSVYLYYPHPHPVFITFYSINELMLFTERVKEIKGVRYLGKEK